MEEFSILMMVLGFVGCGIATPACETFCCTSMPLFLKASFSVVMWIVEEMLGVL
jgi:hypothetical protein